MLPIGEERTAARLYSDVYNVYVRPGSALTWDGKSFGNLHGSVATQTGFVVADHLQAIGVSVLQSGKGADQGLMVLQSGTVAAAVLRGTHANFLINNDPRFRGKLAVLPKPFLTVTLQLFFSKKTDAQAPERIRAVWDAIAVEPESPAYQAQEKMQLLLH